MPTSTDTRSARGSARRRAEIALGAQRLRAPATSANMARNARAERGRHARWATARDALWRVLDPELPSDARVAVVGAGNADSVPLTRIAARAGTVTLIDVDGPAIRAACRRQPRRRRRRIEAIQHDITDGAADTIARAAATGEVPVSLPPSQTPLPGAPYDLVIGDLLYSQLLYPALVDLDVPPATTAECLARCAPILTRCTVARLNLSAREGRVVHVHDPIAWWPGHWQTFTLELILATAERDLAAALSLVAGGTGPHHSDPRRALRALSIPIRSTTLWRWPFAPGVDYLACATVTGMAPGRAVGAVGGERRAASPAALSKWRALSLV
jgi:hypothetical protein